MSDIPDYLFKKTQVVDPFDEEPDVWVTISIPPPLVPLTSGLPTRQTWADWLTKIWHHHQESYPRRKIGFSFTPEMAESLKKELLPDYRNYLDEDFRTNFTLFGCPCRVKAEYPVP
jgi:hypothetical protein